MAEWLRRFTNNKVTSILGALGELLDARHQKGGSKKGPPLRVSRALNAITPLFFVLFCYSFLLLLLAEGVGCFFFVAERMLSASNDTQRLIKEEQKDLFKVSAMAMELYNGLFVRNKEVVKERKILLSFSSSSSFCCSFGYLPTIHDVLKSSCQQMSCITYVHTNDINHTCDPNSPKVPWPAFWKASSTPSVVTTQ